MEDSFYRMEQISEQELIKIKEETKDLLKEFNRKLDKLKQEFVNSFEKIGLRKEENGWKPEQDFKEAIFQNANFIEDDLIIAERGNWK